MSESEYYGTGCQPSSGFFPIPKCKTVTPPMLSDKEMQEWRHNHRAQYKAGDGPTYTEGIEDARYFYENAMAEGRLMVVKTARMIDEPGAIGGPAMECSACGVSWPVDIAPKVGESCRCGAKIVEA